MVAAGEDVDELEAQLAKQETELADRAERVEELINQVESLEADLDEATSTTTTQAPTTTTTTSTTAPPTTEEPAAEESVGERNARQKAQEYLDFMSFSHSGLVDQLVFEGFTQAEAEHGVDSLNVDWNEQAAMKAEEYLDYSAFSRSGLIDQLVFEGFTQAQAEHGVNTTGL